ncbi:MAG: [protein-PII] uridylyltransferase [Ilumatobacteraceae bacterium]
MTDAPARSLSARAEVISDFSLRGIEACRALSAVTDTWLRDVFAAAVEGEKKADRIALLAVGGYGREELAPHSDLDLLLVHDGVRNIADIASRIWYPAWDAGLKLGHSVRTPRETAQMCATDLDTATALVTARHLAGNESLAAAVVADAAASWSRRGGQWLVELHQRVRERHAEHGEVAFMLEPNLKEGLGGLRDIHTLGWAVRAGLALGAADTAELERCNDVLLAVRVALHRQSGRAVETLRLEDQAAVAAACGHASDNDLMAAIAGVGRSVAWIADEAWARLDPPAGRSPVPVDLAPGVQLVNGEIHLADDVDVSDPTLLLRVATAAARHRARIDRSSLDRLGSSAPVWPDPWPAGASDDLVALLLEGEAAITVLEALDQRNLIVKVLPEWAPVRSRPQRNAYHRYTVDRHLWQTAANAARLVERVSRPDLLMIGALMHDIGKGYPGDHTEVGVELWRTLGARMGLTEADQEIVSLMIEHHLLLADTATRRDLSDDATITMVAGNVGTQTVLDLLHALTEADSLATGPSAWSDWKAELLSTLVERVRHVLGGGDVQEVVWRLFPDANVLEMMAGGTVSIRTEPDRVTVVSPDAPGTFSKVAGVMALHGLDVLGAEAHSDEQGMAASQFRVVPGYSGAIEWEPVVANLERALGGRLALGSRLSERAATVRPRRAVSADVPSAPSVRFDDSASSNATFLEVRAPDRFGLLHRVTKAMADLGLDIRHARVLTLGNEVVDSFYVCDVDGGKIVDAPYRTEIERAILHAVDAN